MVDRYTVNVVSSFANTETKAGYGGSVRLDAFHEFITGPHDEPMDALLTVSQAYRRVPWLRRGVNLRAYSVAHMPFALYTGDTDVSESHPFAHQLVRLLQLVEKSVVLYGKAYWLIETNRMGKQPTPRFIPAAGVKPVTDNEHGLVGFKIKMSTGERFVLSVTVDPSIANEMLLKYGPDLTETQRLNRMVYFHLPSADSEVDCDPAPAESVLEAASLLHAANRVASRFYAGGMVPVSLVVVPAQTQAEEMQRVEAFFKRMATGMKNIFRALAVRAGVEVKTIGHTIREARASELIMEARDDVAVGLDIPPTVLDGKAANFATAKSEWFGFITNTIVPECEWIEDIINDQYLVDQALHLTFEPHRLEVMQAVQLEQAEAVMALLNPLPGESLIDREQALALLGFPTEEEMSGENTDESAQDERDEYEAPKAIRLNWQKALAVRAKRQPLDSRRRRRHEEQFADAVSEFFDGQRRRARAELNGHGGDNVN